MKRTLSYPVREPSNPPPSANGHDIFSPREILPLVGRISPESILISVDLPAPFRPNIAIRSPIATLNDIPSSPRPLPFSVSNSLTRLVTTISRRSDVGDLSEATVDCLGCGYFIV